jgi:hypothetical protein
MTVEKLIELLETHALGGAYIDLETGCIDGHFNFKALAEELNAVKSCKCGLTAEGLCPVCTTYPQ